MRTLKALPIAGKRICLSPERCNAVILNRQLRITSEALSPLATFSMAMLICLSQKTHEHHNLSIPKDTKL